jgi:branched-chain amino acid transport system substrate-binding protein
MMTKKLVLCFTVIVMVVAFGFAHVRAQEVIKIGHVTSLTGPGSLWGLVGKEAFTLGLEDLNAKGGINGKKVELIIYDSQSKPAVAATLTQRLIFEDKVSWIFGSGSSIDNLAMMEVTEKAKTPLFIAASASPLITEKGYKWVWRLALNDKLTADMLAKYINTKPQWNKIAVLHENSDYGRPISEMLADQLGRSKGKQVVATESFNRGDTDVSGQLAKIKRASPDFLVVWGYQSDLALIARQRQQLGLKVPVLGNSSMAFPDYIQLGGSAVEGDMFLTTINSQINPNPNVQAFAKRYEERFHRPLSVGVIEPYDGTTVARDVLTKTGMDPEKIQKALNTLSFGGIAGPIQFDAKGQCIHRSVVLGRIEGGKFKFVEFFQY